MMQVVALVNRKGGVGKTTLAVSLASALSRQAKVLVLDADPQASVLQWADQCNGFAFDVQPFDLAQGEIPTSDYDYVIIDFPPGFSDEEFDRHLAQLTQILVPVNASPLDLWATVSFASLLDASAKERGMPVRSFLVFNQIERDNRFASSAIGAARGLGIRVAKTIVGKRAVYRNAALEGKAIHQMGGRAKQAIEDVDELINEVFGHVNA